MIKTLYQMFHKAGLPLYFEYVAEKDLPVYEKAVQAAGMKMQSISKEKTVIIFMKQKHFYP